MRRKKRKTSSTLRRERSLEEQLEDADSQTDKQSTVKKKIKQVSRPPMSSSD